MAEAPLILVANDDGVDAPGLRAAARVAGQLGEVVVAAPRDEQSSMSRAFPRLPEGGRIELRPLELPGCLSLQRYAICGSPAQAVSHAVLELCHRQPALCICGVNYGENVGSTISASGTIGAALEAASYAIPALAISVETDASASAETYDWSAAEFFTLYWSRVLLDNPMPEDIAALNINVPREAKTSTPMVRTRHSRQPYFVFDRPVRVALDQPWKLPVRIEIDWQTLEADSDIAALRAGRVSVTPLSWSISSCVPWFPLDAGLEYLPEA